VPLRVLYLIPTLAGGGAERVVIEHLRRLPRDRFSPELALYHEGGPLRAHVPADVPVHCVSATWFPRTPTRRRLLRRLIDERRIDVVSSHIGHANFLNLFESVGRRRRVARVVTFHLDRRESPRRLESRFRLPLQRLLCDRVSRAVFLCQATADATARDYAVRPEQVAVIPNGVDPEDLRALAGQEPAPRWPPGKVRLIAAGRLVEQKGFDLLLRALAIARGRGLDASLLLLGEGRERSALERLRRELGLEGAVFLPGFLPNPYPALREADVYVLSSRYEGFPLVLLEAMALGRPVVAADCLAGPADLLAGGAGVLVPPRDPEALAAALVDLGGDAARRADLSRRAAACAEEYRWPGIIERTATMLAEAARSG